MQTLSFDVGGMTCGGCRVKVEHRLGQLAGVSQAMVDLQPGLATVVIDPALASPAQVISAINEARFSATARTTGADA
ncbi:heavy-metal-associated domain-containing protein [Caenimonas sedimenti]|uniref:Heavy-metal-associated domain-containing protein n=1 Tax=Caenimonas sedimenti TaxID=2596921 RepID=A0A562ZXA0_9BURK|nr:heavy-metal-associated domain-containing protein [Caenimonas sedimenti]TWO73011.1 heavy-metal-associated domain-containing protein [Caenimonas sedimenti]